jgi:hypothetical protein
MTDQPPGIPAVIDAYGLAGPALEAIPEAKAFALEQAVELLKEWQGTFDEDRPITSWVNRVVEAAETFEEYLTGGSNEGSEDGP